MIRLRLAPLAIVATALIGACVATASPPLTEPGAAFAELSELEQRVAAVAFRLSIANIELCPRTGPQTGLTLHNAVQYGPETREAAVRYFHLTDAPGVLAIAPGSPAEQAGLMVDDAILALDSVSLAAPAPADAPATYDTLADAWGRLDAGLASGHRDLLIERAGKPMHVRLEPVIGCAYRVQLVPSAKMSATANPTALSITTAFARYLASDDNLALLIGHEFAHEVLHHSEAASREKERQADYVGAYLAARAGYDLSGAARFWRAFGEDSWVVRLGVFSHPSASARARALEAAAAEIARKRAEGSPLRPEGLPAA